MKIKFLVLFLCGAVLLCCGDDPKSEIKVENQEQSEGHSRITAKTIEDLKYTDYVLSSEAEDVVSTWEKYRELDTQISYLKKADFSFFNGDIELLTKFIDGFKAGLPENLKTNPIISRVAIIETALLKLNENLTLDNIKRKDKLFGIKEVLVSFANLNYQINKKLERDMFDKIQPE
ncbi:hypothetical protein DFQ11_101611 [Winogradskyella epiphytica]|uniref:Uncharacterized protein n=1 Tax=Winogradskyella epiphytica TaxID=262005 RepID=A0A2V4XIP4_9FLAO|nr:hypothetical protein [Winogradskyella epiphytica]PYE83180.1 hypothetical protein DFQ11_101611 [Winogradskyella epiphytica]GGW56411.1 hypothetical protein GCM10008085_04780 [Winogradskyella epiphytica]